MRLKIILGTFVMLFVVAIIGVMPVSAQTSESLEQARETDFESAGQMVNVGILKKKCGRKQWLDLSLYGENHCLRQQQVYTSYIGPLLNKDGSAPLLGPDGQLIPIQKWDTIDATRNTTIRTPLLTADDKPIYDNEGRLVFEEQVIIFKDARSAGGTLGKKYGLNLIQWGDANGQDVRSFWAGIPAQEAGNGFGNFLSLGNSPFNDGKEDQE